MPSTKGSKTAGEMAGAGKVASENPAETSVGQGDAPTEVTSDDPVSEAFKDMEDKGEVTRAGTTHVRYKGRANVRDFRESDFTFHGISDQKEVVFNEANRWIAAVSLAAADYLVGQPMGEFVRVSDEEAEWEDDEPPVQQVPEFGVEPGTGGVALAVSATPDSVR